MRRRGLLVMTLAALLLTMLMAAGLWQWAQETSLDTVETRLDHWQPCLTVLRWSFIVMLAVFWPQIVRVFEARGKFSQPQSQALQASRWRVTGWLIVIELVLGQNLVGRFVEGVAGT